MTNISISREQYESLIDRSHKLAALEAGGVDNWEFYGESLHDYELNKSRKEKVHDLMTDLLNDLSKFIDAPAGWEAGYGICGDEPYDYLQSFVDSYEEIMEGKCDD